MYMVVSSSSSSSISRSSSSQVVEFYVLCLDFEEKVSTDYKGLLF